MSGCIPLRDGSMGHEHEAFWDGTSKVMKRDPNGWHMKNGDCDCSFDCCLQGDSLPYVCVCEECTEPDGPHKDPFSSVVYVVHRHGGR